MKTSFVAYKPLIIWSQLSWIVELLVTNMFRRFAGGEHSGNDEDKKKGLMKPVT